MNSYTDEKRPEQIEHEIELTRVEMAHTLDAIQRRLSPEQLLDWTLSSLRGGPSEFGSNLGRTVTQNPVPVALVGIGLAWLMASSSNTYSQRYSPQKRYPTVPQSARSLSPSMGERLGEAGNRVEGAAASARDRVGETAASARDRVESAAASARDRVEETAASARDKAAEAAREVQHQAEHLGDQVHYQTQQLQNRFRHMLQEQPLVLGALGIAVGAALGASIPPTRREDELMGETRDHLKHRAEDVGREQLHKAERVAAAARDATQEEADKQGLTPGSAEEQFRQAKTKVENVAATARDAAKEEANRQGLTSKTRDDLQRR